MTCHLLEVPSKATTLEILQFPNTVQQFLLDSSLFGKITIIKKENLTPKVYNT